MEPTVTEKRRPGGYMGYMEHHMVFPASVTKVEVEEYVKKRDHFGYHPSGYGGHVEPFNQQSGTNWVYSHSLSCD